MTANAPRDADQPAAGDPPGADDAPPGRASAAVIEPGAVPPDPEPGPDPGPDPHRAGAPPLPDAELDHWSARYAEALDGARVADAACVLVQVGGERFAVVLDDLDEVACLSTAIALPHVASLVLGLANIRGELLPLLDTGALLGVAGGCRLGTTNRTLVVRDHRGRRVGLPVDRVEAVEALPADLFHEPGRDRPSELGGDGADLIRRAGLAEHRGAALTRLDLGALRAGRFSHF